jgi:hypothetical protein
MTKIDYYNELLENGQTKVPHSYAIDILVMLLDNSRDAQIIKIDENYSVMLLIY